MRTTVEHPLERGPKPGHFPKSGIARACTVFTASLRRNNPAKHNPSILLACQSGSPGELGHCAWRCARKVCVSKLLESLGLGILRASERAKSGIVSGLLAR